MLTDSFRRLFDAYDRIPESEKKSLFRILLDEIPGLLREAVGNVKKADRIMKREGGHGKIFDNKLRKMKDGEFGRMLFHFILFGSDNPVAAPYVKRWLSLASKKHEKCTIRTIIQECEEEPLAKFIQCYFLAVIDPESDIAQMISVFTAATGRDCTAIITPGSENVEAVDATPEAFSQGTKVDASLDSPHEVTTPAPVIPAPPVPAPPVSETFGATEEPVGASRSFIETRRDQCAAKVLHRDAKHPILIHSDVFELMKNPALGKRLNLVLTHLAAHGSTSIVKGCKDDANRGWLRTPLSGNHYYLWWARSFSDPVRNLELDAGSILVRAVRHHDEHTPLDAGRQHDLMNVIARDLVDDHYSAQPWTEEQKMFIFDERPVRVLIGNPGSGKTTALWKAVSARSHQKVLYLTWSKNLVQMAQEHFGSFAGQDVEIVARDLSSFWGEILGRDILSVDVTRSLRGFEAHASQLDARQLGEWRNSPQALHAEARAVVYGMADPLAEGSQLGLLDHTAYTELRQDSLGSASQRVVPAVAAIDTKLRAAEWIPELEAAAQAARWIRDHGVPNGWDRFDRIVIDEVQDLTKLELRALMLFFTAVARNQKRLPWLLVAGDEGQTVVPTHFRWGWLKDTIHKALTDLVGNPQALVLECKLDSNLRCPSNICKVLDRATALYGRLPKIDKPGDQSPPSDGQVHDACLIHVVCKTTDEAVEVLGKLTTRDDFVVLSLDDELRWTGAADANGTEEMVSLRDLILSPSMAKGLEYQSVCIINPGRKLLEIKSLTGTSERLSEMAARTMIDQFRVALSRATGDLIFLDVQPTDQEFEESRGMLVRPVEVDAIGLANYYKDFETSAEDRVRSRLKLAQNFVETEILRAWRLANEAMRMLGDPHMTDGVADPDLRRDVSLEVLKLAALLILDETDDKDLLSQANDAGDEALGESASESDRRIFTTLQAWTDHIHLRGSPLKTAETVIDFLDAVVEAEEGRSWIEPVLAACAQRLRSDLGRVARDVSCAGRLAGPVAEWLRIAGDVGEVHEKAKMIRRTAFKTLMEAERLNEAQSILDQFAEGDHEIRGQMFEARQSFSLAAAEFESAGMTEAALRNWRQAGCWEEALRLAEGGDKTHLAWLCEITSQLDAMPDDHQAWMTTGERQRFGKLLPHFTANASDGKR
jgi:hypothetical protein